MKNVKIVFVDLDGTLRDSTGKISNRAKKIIKRLRDIGITVVFVTGRPVPYTVKLAKQFDPSSFIVCSNGAEVYNYISKRIIYKSTIMNNDILFLNDLIDRYHLYFMVNTIDKIYTNKDFDNIGKKYVKSLTDIDADIDQIVVQSYKIDDLKLFRRDLGENTNLKIINKPKNIDDSGVLLYYDVVNSDVSKGNAIRELCAFLNIPLDRTMGIGDSMNDLEMLEVCSYKVAMGNASEEIKNISNYETLSNDEDGVSVILERLYEELTK